MSRASLLPFKNGLPKAEIEFSNAWGGAARIWDALFKSYVPKKHEHDTWLSNPHDRRLWDLALRKDIPVFEIACHCFTFDRFFVKRENFKRLSADLTIFAAKYPSDGCDHLPAWAEWLERNKYNEEIEAVGLRATSASENLWYEPKKCPHCGHDEDETEPVPLSEGTEVYEWLQSRE